MVGARRRSVCPLIGEVVAKRRVGDRDQGVGALVDRVVAQMGDAVLGDHDVGIGARTADHVALAEARHDARGPAARGVDGSARIDRPPLDRRAPRTKSSRPPVPLTCRPLQHLGVGLAQQVDRQHRVDRDEVVDLRDDADVVGVADRREPEVRAAARPLVDPRAAERGGADHGPGVVRLARPGQDAGLVQLRHLVADQAAVQTEIAAIAQRREHGGRHLADADLDGVAVRDQAGHVRADAIDLRRQATRRERHQRTLGLDHVVEAVVGELVAGRGRGIAALTSATITLARSRTAGTKCTDTPETTAAGRSGGATWISARSISSPAR